MTDSDVASPEPDDGTTAAAGSAASDAERTTEVDGTETADTEEEAEESLGWRGWVLVGALVVSFLVVPWTIIALPRAQGFLGSVGLGWRDAYLVLPLLPALGLGVLAVWAAVAARRET